MMKASPEFAKQRGAQTVLIYMPGFGGGGAERVLKSIAKYLVASGCTVHVAIAAGDVAFDDAAIRVHRLPQSFVRRVLALGSIIRRYNLRAALSSQVHGNVGLVLAKLVSCSKVRAVIREASTHSRHRQFSAGWKGWLLSWAGIWIYRGADCVVAVSQGVADDLLQLSKGRLRNVTVVPNPVIEGNEVALAERPTGFYWMDSGRERVLVSAGRLEPYKGHAALLEAFAALPDGCLDRLVILGEGPEKARLQGLAKNLGIGDRLSMPGFVENPYSFMRRAAVFVLASEFEGMPGVLVQALACGCPVVSTDCPSGPREILDGGKYGRLVPTGCSQTLCDAIVKELSHPSCDADSRRKRAELFSIQRQGPAYRAILLNDA